jgi:ATP-binding cassette subfamily B protein
MEIFYQPVRTLSQAWESVQQALAGAERVSELLDESPDVVERSGAVELSGRAQGHISLQNVGFRYSKGEMVLEDIDLDIPAGTVAALVGATGVGKTTLANLIPRFYDVCEGAVRIDGIDVREVSADSLRSQIGIVLQDTFLFSTTVMENIRFGRPEANDEEVIAAARLAHADSFIERLPEGYQTVLGERGSGLSQGQRQLLAIARAALADPRILILDEATSSVDTRTERLIQQALEELLRNRTSFVIAHRLSTIRNADRLLVIDEGRIVERGTHEELLERQGFYYELYMSQFRRDDQPAFISGDGRSKGEELETLMR